MVDQIKTYVYDKLYDKLSVTDVEKFINFLEKLENENGKH